ncbi:MAG: hypothetical protein QGI75_01800 [Phycisphaerales bacterium]|jgi:hypothetical protein|nr:hypothetical protein [Phycisphaerales bacterium]
MRDNLIAAFAIAALAATASADLLIDDGVILDVTATVGTGEFTSYAVIDFAATGGTSHAFAYQWSGEATAHDMLLAVGDSGLVYDWTDWGNGIFADNFAWNGDVGEWSYFWAHSLASPEGNGIVDWSDAWTSVDTTWLSDGLISGWYNGFNDDYSAITPTLPLTAIPGPATVAVLVLLGGRRRR